MSLREMQQAIRPATEADLQPTVSSGMRSTVAALMAPGKTKEVPETHSRKRQAVRVKERVDAPAQGKTYNFWHRCLGYHQMTFATDREARLWAMAHGYQVD